MGRPKSIRIETGARLHFGLLDTSPPFGGLGVMIDEPRTTVEVSASETFRWDAAIEHRARPIVQRFGEMTSRPCSPALRITRRDSAPEHCGFGSGTQLCLAIAEGLVRSLGENVSDESLAIDIAGRGKRSAIGVHGYFHGGLIFETSDATNTPLNPIHTRLEMPDDWRIVLMHPKQWRGQVFGEEERRQFSRLPSDPKVARRLRETVETGILPAAADADFDSFAESIQRYNRQSGMMFSSVQGGPYNGAAVTELVGRLSRQGAMGVGQSSWGPAVFAWCRSEADAVALVDSVDQTDVESMITTVRNEPRQLCLASS